MAVNGASTVPTLRSYAGKIVTIERFILDQQQSYPDATGALTSILYDICLAAKIIASKTTRAGLADILGSAGKENVQGETVQKLDEYADQIIFKLNDHGQGSIPNHSRQDQNVIDAHSEEAVSVGIVLFWLDSERK